MKNSKIVTLNFHSFLQKFTKKESIELEVSDYYDLVSASFNLFPEMDKIKNILDNSQYENICLVDNDKIIKRNELDFPVKGNNLYLCPLLKGSVSVIDFLRDSATYDLFGLSFGSADLIDYTVSEKRILDSVLFGNIEKITDIDAKENFRFTTPTLTTSTRTPIALHFGMVRVTGQLINSYVKAAERNADDYTIINTIDLD